MGITLGAVPDKLTVRRGPVVCIPWADIEQIILYPTYPRGQGGYARVQCIGIQRRPGPGAARANEQAARGAGVVCPCRWVPQPYTLRATGNPSSIVATGAISISIQG